MNVKSPVNGDLLRKPEVRFWVGLATLAVTVAIWGTRLEGRVLATEVQRKSILGKLEVLERNQIRIMVNLGIEP